jgi:uncharacterized protein YndB with AHSA1/START domain
MNQRGALVAEYKFLTTWCIKAPIEATFDVLNDSAGYPRWWKGVTNVEVLEGGDEMNVGELVHFTWRSVLPYSLEFDLRVTRVERRTSSRVTPPASSRASARGGCTKVTAWPSSTAGASARPSYG